MNVPRVLLVEDSEDDVLLTLRSFERNNIANEVIVARDGVEALDYLFCRGRWEGRDMDELPAFILLDLKLPKLDGHEVLREIRENPLTRRLPVVILTSSLEESDLARGYDGGANSYVRKPVAFETLVDAVRQLGMYWLLLNERPPVPETGER